MRKDFKFTFCRGNHDNLFCFVCCFTSQSTAMVMAEWSVHLTTLFLGKLEQAVYQYFVHKLSLVMPRSHIHGSPRRFYYGLNLRDDPGNANFCSPIRMHYIRMIKYYYV